MAILIIRGLALFQFLQLWPHVWLAVSAIHFSMPEDQEPLRLAYYLVPFVSVAFLLFLWFWAPWIANKMMQSITDEPAKDTSLSFDDIFIVATVSVGLFIFSNSIPYLTRFVLSIAEIPARIGEGRAFHWRQVGLEAPFYLVLATLLIFTPGGLLKLVKFTRRAGQQPEETA